jgi:hypothetical protein
VGGQSKPYFFLVGDWGQEKRSTAETRLAVSGTGRELGAAYRRRSKLRLYIEGLRDPHFAL